jgi:hypothetical protein
MFRISRSSLFTSAVILALLFSAFPLGAVMAEGEDPAPTETPIAEEVPAMPEEAPPPVEEAAPTVEEVIAQAPEDVVVVLMDEAGEPLPMTEEASINAYVRGDPIFCPANVLFLDLHNDDCTETLPSIEAAIAVAVESGSGTIYVATDYEDSTPSPLLINGEDWFDAPNWLALIGGVDIASEKIVGKTTLSRPLDIRNLSGFWMQNFIIKGLEDTALTVDAVNEVDIFDSEFSENLGAGLDIQNTGNVILADLSVNRNGEENQIAAGFVSVYGSSFSENSENGGLSITAKTIPESYQGNVTVYGSKFNHNFGTGLTVLADGLIAVDCSQAQNNSFIDPQNQSLFADGMKLTSNLTGIALSCNKLRGNNGYGLEVSAPPGTVFLASNDISVNGLINGTLPPQEYAACSYICPSCSGGGSSGEEEKPTEGNTQVVIVKVGEGDGIAEIKPGYSTVFKLYEQEEENQRLVQLTALTSGSAPSGSSAVYTPLDESTLPAPLPEGASLIPWGFNLTLTNPDGTPVESLIGYMLVRFYLPEGFVLPGGMRLVIQHYDPATSSWEPMSTSVGGGTAFTYASKPGTYVLTMEPIQ